MPIDLGDIPSGTSPSPAEQLQIRKAIGVGTTDAPTFLAQTLTGQSLTGTQATSLVDLATTWDTTGTPTGIKLDVTNTNSNPAALLMDLQVDGLSKFKVAKGGEFSFRSGSNFASISTDGTGRILLNSSTSAGARVVGDLLIGSNDVVLVRDSASGILAQRNGTAKQTLRIYNTYTSASIYERAVMDWNGPTPGNLQIGTEFLGTGSGMAARPIDFVTGGVVRMSISAAGDIGIGTSAPVWRFQVAGDNFAGSTIGQKRAENVIFGPYQIFEKARGTVAAPSAVSSGDLLGGPLFYYYSGSAYTVGAGVQGYMSSASTSGLAFFTSTISGLSDAKMVINATGNLGIGTTTPASKLQVTAGDIEVDTVTNGIILKAAGTSTRYRLTLNAGGTALVFTAV